MADTLCAGCSKPMGFGEYEVAGDKEYHVECFVCALCRGRFDNGEFFTDDTPEKRPCHKKCLDANEKPKAKPAIVDVCAECNQTIPTGTEFFAVKDGTDGTIKRTYHMACFKCKDCGKPIGDKKYVTSHGQPVHQQCTHGAEVSVGNTAAEFAEGTVCQRCNQPIQGQKKNIPEFGSFHLTCFRCSVCGLGITKEYFKDPKTGKPRCHRCPI